jgi:transcriptional regulator with XRE-family HTH domain
VKSRVECDQDQQQSRQFAVLLNHLFATRLAPEGRPYTLTEVSKATGMSVPYLSILRKGSIGAVSLQRADALARFFHVSLDYFSQEGPPVDSIDDLVRAALAQPLVREVTLQAGKVGAPQRALVLQMLDHAEHVLQDLAAAPGAPLAAEPRTSHSTELAPQKSAS